MEHGCPLLRGFKRPMNSPWRTRSLSLSLSTMDNHRQKLHHRLLDLHPRPPSRNATFSSSLLDAIDQSQLSGGASQRTTTRPVNACTLSQDRRLFSNKSSQDKLSVNLNQMQERRPFSILTSSFPRSPTKLHVERKLDQTPKTYKSPLSPGARIAGFLNSLFSPKTKLSSVPSKGGDETGISSAPLRSCLKKPAPKRSVRFTDEDRLYFPSLTAIRVREDTTKQKSSMEQKKRVAIARKLVSSYEERKRGFTIAVVEEEDDDAASCCSADLFELKDLSLIRINRDKNYDNAANLAW